MQGLAIINLNIKYVNHCTPVIQLNSWIVPLNSQLTAQIINLFV